MRRTISVHYFSATDYLRQPSRFQQSHSSIADRIKKCSTLTELEHLYASLLKTGASRDAFLTNQFIAAFSGFLRLDYAVSAFHQTETPNVFVSNAMIGAFLRSGHPDRALQCYVDTLRADVSPTSYTFPALIRACATLPESRCGEAVHGQVWRQGFDSHVHVQTSLVIFYSKACKATESRKVFDEMPERDGFAWAAMISAHLRAGDTSSAASLFHNAPERNAAAWNAMIGGHARSGDVASAEALFHRMPFKDAVSWTAMIACYSRGGRYREALAAFEAMPSPDGVATAAAVSACAHLGSLEAGKELHRRALRSGFDLDAHMGSALVDMYAKCGSLDASLLVFLKLRERDRNLFCWNSMIEGLSSHGRAAEALAVFRDMTRSGAEPNSVTFVSVLSACARSGLVEEGRRSFSSMEADHRVPPGVEHYGCMVDLLSKAGFLDEALGLIRAMRVRPNSAVWGALLAGCRLRGNWEVGRVAAGELAVLEPGGSGHYHLMAEMFAGEKRWREVETTWARMRELGVEKTCPGSSWLETENRIHRFSASDGSHPASPEIYGLLKELTARMKLAGYVPQL